MNPEGGGSPPAGADRGVHEPEAGLRAGLKVFAAPADQRRSRRAADVVLLVSALAGVVLAIVAYPPGWVELSLERFFDSIPGWLDPVWGALADLLWLWAIVLAVLALVRRRLVVVAQALASLAVALAVAVCAARLAIYWSGIGRVVYALGSETFRPLVECEETLSLSCREVFARGGRPVEVAGPALEDRALAVHEGFW